MRQWFRSLQQKRRTKKNRKSTRYVFIFFLRSGKYYIYDEIPPYVAHSYVESYRYLLGYVVMSDCTELYVQTLVCKNTYKCTKETFRIILFFVQYAPCGVLRYDNILGFFQNVNFSQKYRADLSYVYVAFLTSKIACVHSFRHVKFACVHSYVDPLCHARMY